MIKKRAGEKMTLADAARRMSQLPVDGMIFNLRQMVDDFDTFEAPKDLKTVIITPMEHPTCSTVSDDQEGGRAHGVRVLLESRAQERVFRFW